jgi:hypothetical protein
MPWEETINGDCNTRMAHKLAPEVAAQVMEGVERPALMQE